ncbi:MAG: hypothetical protein JWL86_2143, partial [Rhizobium sp.]|nr:hypothetical protein [Rhizobium sp.]
MTRAYAIDLGRLDRAVEIEGPRAYEVRTGNRYLNGLEDGEIGYWPDYHLFTLNERTGHITIEGGYGTFSYCWHSRGRDGVSLHAFLYDLEFSYFIGKASKQPYRISDYDQTIVSMKRQVIEYRRQWGNSKEWARKVWDDIIAVDGLNNDQEIMSYFWNSACSETYEMFASDGGPFVMVDHPGLRRFWDEVWAAFRDQILKPHWDQHNAERVAAQAE